MRRSQYARETPAKGMDNNSDTMVDHDDRKQEKHVSSIKAIMLSQEEKFDTVTHILRDTLKDFGLKLGQHLGDLIIWGI